MNIGTSGQYGIMSLYDVSSSTPNVILTADSNGSLSTYTINSDTVNTNIVNIDNQQDGPKIHISDGDGVIINDNNLNIVNTSVSSSTSIISLNYTDGSIIGNTVESTSFKLSSSSLLGIPFVTYSGEVLTLDIFPQPRVAPILSIDLNKSGTGTGIYNISINFNIKPDDILTASSWIFYLSNNINTEPNTHEGTYVVPSEDPETPYYFTVYDGEKTLDAYTIVNSNTFYKDQHSIIGNFTTYYKFDNRELPTLYFYGSNLYYDASPRDRYKSHVYYNYTITKIYDI